MGFSHYGTKAYIMYPITNGEYTLTDLTHKNHEYVITISDGPEKNTKLIESMHCRQDANRYSNRYIKSRVVPAEKALIFDPEKWGHHDGAFRLENHKKLSRELSKEEPVVVKPVTMEVRNKNIRKFASSSYESIIAFIDSLYIKQIIKIDELQAGVIVTYDKYTLTNEKLIETYKQDRDYSLKGVKFTIDTNTTECIYKDMVYQNHVLLWIVTETSHYVLTMTKDQWKRIFKLYNSRVITIQSAYENETITLEPSLTYKVIDTYLKKSETGA